ncbi:MAG: hypothetical protein KTR18_05045 [Acidiferrobacterales bacterium]|nr:hypothetical protein [Acidiferrobacterales bacterium]
MNTAGEKWYTRPVFSVSNMEASLAFYCTDLEFTQNWKYEEQEKTLVTQVTKGEFELILAGNLDRVGTSRVFVSLEKEEMEQLKSTIFERQIAYQELSWGYPCIQLSDPDGNLLWFPEDESE